MSKTFLPFHQPEIGPEEIRSVVETLESGWLTSGSKAKIFEEDFSRFIGCQYSVAVNSCTAALHLALEAVGIEEGDEVIVPTMTFTATAEVVVYFKAKPVLVDCRPNTLNIDPDLIERSITTKTKAIIPVHFGGQSCDMDAILRIARKHKLYVIEDAAHALPAKYHGKTIGTIGDITCFSFYATKTITTCEGGMATTQNPDWAARMRMMSLHGISQDAWKRYTKEGSWYYEVVRPGFKYNLTDIGAAIGIEQLKKCDAFGAARARIAATYDQEFSDLLEIETPVCESDLQHAWHLYVIQLNLDQLKIDRHQFIEALKEQGIGTSVHFIPLHLHRYYRESFGSTPEEFPMATEIYQRIVSLPIYPKMTESQIARVVEAVRNTVQRYRR